jgi:hypothetical protein
LNCVKNMKKKNYFFNLSFSFATLSHFWRNLRGQLIFLGQVKLGAVSSAARASLSEPIFLMTGFSKNLHLLLKKLVTEPTLSEII